MPESKSARTVHCACVLWLLLAPIVAEAQTVQPATAREGAVRLVARHFGGPGDATVDYFGQLLARTIGTVPPGAVPLDPIPAPARARALALSVAYQRLTFRTFEGMDLDGGNISSFSGGLARTPITYVTTANLSADVATLFLAASLSPRLALTVRAPVVRLRMSGELQVIEDRGTSSEERAANPVRVAASSFSGLGDVTTAVRWWLLERDRVRLAGLAGIRWPTGDQENLIGAGEMVPEAGVLASMTAADALTVDVAVSFANGHGTKMGEFSALPFSGPIVTSARPLDTWTYGTAARWTPHPRVRVHGDVVFETMLQAVAYDRAAVRSASAVQQESRLIPRPSALTVGSAGMTVLFHVAGSAFATVGMTAPLTAGRGLQPGVTPRIGLQLGR